MHLTTGQAERVLAHIGKNPAALTSGGRGNPTLEKIGTAFQWTLLALTILAAVSSSVGGIILAIGIVALVFFLRKARKIRQAWEDLHWNQAHNAPISQPSSELEVDPNSFMSSVSKQKPSAVMAQEIFSPDSQPFKPSLPPYSLSLGQKIWPNLEVVGEFSYASAIRDALRSGTNTTLYESQMVKDDLPVTLVAEPDNPFDANAVSIRWQNRVLGYMSREDAARYNQPVRRIIASGFSPSTTARLWAYDDGERINARLTVAVPEPWMIAPLNDPPAGDHTLLPWGSAVQVLKEEEHFDVLFDYVPAEGVGLLLVSLHKTVRTLKNGTERVMVEVRLDGERVGELSAVTSPYFLPIIEHTDPIGETLMAYAKITGSALAAQLVLHAIKATQISNDWISTSPHHAPALHSWAQVYVVPNAYSA